jgi:hypothetical protein
MSRPAQHVAGDVPGQAVKRECNQTGDRQLTAAFKRFITAVRIASLNEPFILNFLR